MCDTRERWSPKSADSRLPFEAASLGRLWINVTLGRFRRFALPFLPFTEFEVSKYCMDRRVRFSERLATRI